MRRVETRPYYNRLADAAAKRSSITVRWLCRVFKELKCVAVWARSRAETPLPCLTIGFLQAGDDSRKDAGHIAL